MSYLIKWKFEKLLKRRDFGEIMRKYPVKNNVKNLQYSETLKRDGASPRLGVSRFHT